jgi:hypothetical protein
MPKSPYAPCIPTRGTKVPSHSDWIHEVKQDGFRLIVSRDGDRVRLYTRNGYDWTPDNMSRRLAARSNAPSRDPRGLALSACAGDHRRHPSICGSSHRQPRLLHCTQQVTWPACSHSAGLPGGRHILRGRAARTRYIRGGALAARFEGRGFCNCSTSLDRVSPGLLHRAHDLQQQRPKFTSVHYPGAMPARRLSCGTI